MLCAILALTLAQDSDYLDAAKKAAAWIKSQLDKPITDRTLYSGTPGVILFFTEGYYSTGDKSYLSTAQSLADDLAANYRSSQSNGLYTGLAGSAFALNELGKATRKAKYGKPARDTVALLEKRAVKMGKGIEWPEGYDIVSGSAGIGCFLLYAAKDMGQPRALELAKKAGDRLLEIATKTGKGLTWRMAPTYERRMPNFSHGTAGVSYFLARLYEETKDDRYLRAAKAGADYLIEASNDQGLVFHNDQDGKDLYYLGWCHGPVGTARLFAVLHRVTGEYRYQEWIDKAVATLMKSGIPESQTPGFWNNVGQCCGSAGMAQFFLDIHKPGVISKELSFAKRLTANLMARGSLDGHRLKWIQAEHRKQPDNVQAQIGYMQGAAGIGLLLLHMDRIGWSHGPRVRFPDTPF